MTHHPQILELVYQIFRLDDLLKGAADRITAPLGQSGARWQVLNAVSDEPRTVAEIARMKGYARQSIQRLADILAEEAVVEFRPNPHDQRTQLLTLTRRGRNIFKDIQQKRDLWLKSLESKLKATGIEPTLKFLQDMENILNEETQP